MKTIHKYPLMLGSSLEVSMPRGAKLLDIQMQDLSPTLWALVDDGRTYVMRGIGIYGTGWTLDKADTDKYIATFQQGSYVWHAFDLGERA